MKRLAHILRGFRDGEAGNVTVEFVILFPIILTMFLSTVELGMLTVRQTMLERGLNVAVRDLQIGLTENVDHDTIKELICDYAGLLPDCDNALKLEMQPVDLRAYVAMSDDIDCVDRAEEVNPVRTFTNGQANELMILRACLKFAPIFPNVGLGRNFGKDANGDAIMFAVSAFVNEP
ncbi:TadE-like protein [Pseudooceanicola antarcticus]|uniref:TadE-like protein n=1 Tax=Pseudooceanicola antarcticus TaxID=1247613 RepID=A0A285JBS2_9RHOB|nr:TadE/TadG family type IV pilus assembly protein [Pseudooceanicola antarcticus]SNY57719.1 TadE-like protein [Pseudooceanicola antarcticus]